MSSASSGFSRCQPKIQILPWLLARVPRSYTLVKIGSSTPYLREYRGASWSFLAQTRDEIGEFRRQGGVSDRDRIPEPSTTYFLNHSIIQSFYHSIIRSFDHSIILSFFAFAFHHRYRSCSPLPNRSKPIGGPTTLELPLLLSPPQIPRRLRR